MLLAGLQSPMLESLAHRNAPGQLLDSVGCRAMFMLPLCRFPYGQPMYNSKYCPQAEYVDQLDHNPTC